MLDHDVVEHEARHAACAVLCGLEVSRIDGVGGQTFQGQLKFYVSDDDQRVAQCKTLIAGGDIPAGYPPNDNVADNHDLVHLRRLIDDLHLDASRYYQMRGEVETIMDTPAFKTLKSRFVDALTDNGRLDEQDVTDIVGRWRWDMEQT